jgi:peptidoglycan/xylan/chitin deacetylase (PgdA/CDA1 family)
MIRHRLLLRLLASGVVLFAVLIGVRRLVSARTFQLFGHLVARVPTQDSIVALTFDDGPAPRVADTLIALLAQRGVHATFFVTGSELAAAPEVGAQLVRAGEELGNHSYSHERMLMMSSSRIREEVERTDALIRRAGHVGPIYFRPPYGEKLVGLPWFLASTGRTTIMWSIEPDSYASVAASPDQIVAYVLSNVRPGAVILLHAWYPSRRTSRAALGPMLDSLHARGYRVAPIGQLLLRDAAESK